ncbi:MAG: hypothetical protein LUD72_08760 [Bacteroidales bacterium]|nr:hypothetical protein [Bacteroidales bacterium]
MTIETYPFNCGIMCKWGKVEDAAVYHVNLYINDDLVKSEDEDRNTFIHSFTNLGYISGTLPNLQNFPPYRGGPGGPPPNRNITSTGLNYYVQVWAESRDGQILDTSVRKKCDILIHW